MRQRTAHRAIVGLWAREGGAAMPVYLSNVLDVSPLRRQHRSAPTNKATHRNRINMLKSGTRTLFLGTIGCVPLSRRISTLSGHGNRYYTEEVRKCWSTIG